MNNNKKLGLAFSLTVIAAFSAGFVTAADHREAPLTRALEAVGQNLFGEDNFGVSVVSRNPPNDGTPATIQIDLAGGQLPDDQYPLLLNVFDPAGASCAATAQIAVTPEGVRVIVNPELFPPTGGGIIAEYKKPLGEPPEPCRDGNVRDGNVIGRNPG